LNSVLHAWYNTEPGVPYQVSVVAFTSAGRGAENDFEIFFSQELDPLKVPADINILRLNLTSINVTWTPLTLNEARGFPHYRVAIIPLSSSNHNKRQTDAIMIETNSSYVLFHDLVSTTAYSAIVGVTTGSSDIFMNADPITGIKLCISCIKALELCLICMPDSSTAAGFRTVDMHIIRQNSSHATYV